MKRENGRSLSCVLTLWFLFPCICRMHSGIGRAFSFSWSLRSAKLLATWRKGWIEEGRSGFVSWIDMLRECWIGCRVGESSLSASTASLRRRTLLNLFRRLTIVLERNDCMIEGGRNFKSSNLLYCWSCNLQHKEHSLRHLRLLVDFYSFCSGYHLSFLNPWCSNDWKKERENREGW